MTNTVILVGRLSSDPEPEYVTITVPRTFKNVDGEYETDIIKCRLYNGISQKVMDYCKKGDLIGIRGRLQRKNSNDYTANGEQIIEVIADKITFLSSKKEGEE